MEQLINKLKARLLQSLPGPEAQYRMAPAGRARTDPAQSISGSYRSSAVLALLCLGQDGEWFLPLTQRFSYKGVHSGQISFPGGKADPADRSLQETALRECYEEIGVKENIEIVGQLTQLHIPVSSYVVQPFVGICKVIEPAFVPDVREVKSIIRFKVSDLLNNATIQNGMIELEGENNFRMEAPYFKPGDYKIWGATAMMLSELKEVIAPIF